MLQQRRDLRRVSVFIWFGALTLALCSTFAAPVAYAQTTNLADHVGGYMLGDFESVTPVDFGFGAGKSSLGGDLYTGPATAVVGMDANNNPSGVWSDFGDIQPQYYSGNSNLLFYQQSTTGATHGSKAIQFYNVLGPDTFNGALQMINSGNDAPTAAALAHASALKIDVTFDRTLLQNAGANPYMGVQVAINSPGGFNQGNISYDSLSTVDPATLASTHRVTAQPNYEAGTMNYSDTTNWPGTAPTAASYSQSPVVTGTGTITMTLTIDFTKNLQNGAPGNTDGTNPPLKTLPFPQPIYQLPTLIAMNKPVF